MHPLKKHDFHGAPNVQPYGSQEPGRYRAGSRVDGVTHFWSSSTDVSDLAPLKDLPLKLVHCNGTPEADLSPLNDIKLTYPGCGNTKVYDLSPLKGMPLKILQCDF